MKSCLTAVLLASFFIHTTSPAQEFTVPYSIKATERTENLPPYVAPPSTNLYNGNPNFKVGWGIDSPTGFVSIDGEVWVIFNLGNQYGTHVKVARFRGRDFEHTERQPDGAIDIAEKGISTHFCGGMWYDTSTGTLYAPIHCEYERNISPPAGWTRKKTRLASSTDKGLTWKLEGDILTDSMPDSGDWLRFSGSYFEAGPADFDFYVDTRGGYSYIFACNAYAPKSGGMNNFLWFNEVARCALSDKMAPGKWHKFCNGTWTEPGLGGKASKVCMSSYSIYGRIIYSDSLRKYLRLGVCLGVIDKRFTKLGFGDGSVVVSFCDDLSKQNWSPMVRVLDNPGNDRFGFTVADATARDPFVCGKTLHAYNYWLYNLPSRAIDITFEPGSTPAAGYPKHGSFAYEPLPESGDSIVSRRTRIAGCDEPETVYSGLWKVKRDTNYFQGQAMECGVPGSSVEYSFDGSGIYWRAVADTNGGKADISIDGKFAETVDLYFRDALPNQFAFIKTGLDPARRHTFKATIRSDRNPGSYGTVVRHMAFEVASESDRASAGFSGEMGKNHWRYQQLVGKEYRDLHFFEFVDVDVKDRQTGVMKKQQVFANFWGDGNGCTLGNRYQSLRAVRTWRAPHDGLVRIEGNAAIENDGGSGLTASIVHDSRVEWSSTLKPGVVSGHHDIVLRVSQGSEIRFIASGETNDPGARIRWDPVVTYSTNQH